ncbi:hypothetical protein C453_04084 [Haloferax elongans ATCC BAA-1513]|uniref:Uncharacterized protein n=1 Tax=Haloferax elongans ATCC BAA-1513 TaxID=1230453 RepID=M0HSR8_HALEO|nr:ribbon-helix-helix domain-containing protein [Haloferax elongans]ELZ87501.1 hypothetical protein C453_04084 [Haloferax elongans ATCC BAA-1513]
MSATPDGGESGSRNISIKIGDDFVEDFDRAMKRGQLDGKLPMDMSRSEAIRRLMRKAIDDPSLLAEDEENRQ